MNLAADQQEHSQSLKNTVYNVRRMGNNIQCIMAGEWAKQHGDFAMTMAKSSFGGARERAQITQPFKGKPFWKEFPYARMGT